MLDDVTLNEMKVSTTKKNWKEMGEFIEELNNKLNIEELNNKLNNFKYKKEKENITCQELMDFYQEKLIETNKLVERNNEIEKYINKIEGKLFDIKLTIDDIKLTIETIDDFIYDIENKSFTSKKKKINIVDNIILKIKEKPGVYLGGGFAFLIVLFFYLSNIGNNEIKSLVDSKIEKKILPKPPLK